MPVTPVSERGYANPGLLVESDWLADHLDDAGLRLIDTRSAELYAAGHIPGAVNLAAHGGIPRTADAEMGAPEEFERLAGSLGIDSSSKVVIYDAPGAIMGMTAWAFIYYGLTRVSILDGGFEKWTTETRPTSTTPGSYPEASFQASLVEEVSCTFDHAQAAVGSPGVVFWDVRTAEEYTGTESRNNPRPGHVAGAVHLDWTELLDPITKTFKSGDELRNLLGSRGITPESEINCY